MSLLLGTVNDSLKGSLIHAVCTVNRYFACKELGLCVDDCKADVLRNNGLIDVIVCKADCAVRKAEDLILAIGQLAVDMSPDGVKDTVAYALDGRGDDEVLFRLALVCKSLVGVYADDVFLALGCCLDNAYGSRAGSYEYAVSAGGLLSQGKLFCRRGIHIGTNVGNLHLDVRVYELSAFDVADSGVVDNGSRVLCAYEADYGIFICKFHIRGRYACSQDAC